MKAGRRIAQEAIAMFLFLLCISPGGAAFAQGGVSHFAGSDSSGYESWKWITKHFGGDLFLTGEAYTLHFGRVGFFSLTGGGGLGVEMRLRPVFIGFVADFSSNEVRPNPSGPFFNTTLYCGAIIQKCRVEIGKIHGESFAWDQDAPQVGYDTYFLGIGRRYGSAFFAEPEVKIMLPVVAGYYQYGPPDYYTRVVIEHQGLRDLFFAFSLKLGIGFN